ncbi:uncharacterized protein LOC132041058 [Lycium ferocissimum]|uniref:uncharacterized protein LOC132041058 n=1 Tax=Lycium ferocissimum TaxID=112874 RepID=UPI0028169221|nr:uncharacterized protein LOC132041058 [Lycium ferocissimum]
MQLSNQQRYENYPIQYPYVQPPSDPFLFNQRDMYSSPRPMFNPVPELSFGIGQNLPPEGYNANSNRATIPSTRYLRTRRTRASYRRGRMPIFRGSSSHSGRAATEREYETNNQYQNAPWSSYPARDPRRTPIPNSLYDPSYAENGLPVDPFLRAMQLNPNFSNSRGNN